MDGEEIGLDTLQDKINLTVNDSVYQLDFESEFIVGRSGKNGKWYSHVLLPEIKRDTTDIILLNIKTSTANITANFTAQYNFGPNVFLAIRHEGLKCHIYTKKRHFRKNENALKWSIRGADIKEPEKASYPTAFIGSSYTDCCQFLKIPLKELHLTKNKQH